MGNIFIYKKGNYMKKIIISVAVVLVLLILVVSMFVRVIPEGNVGIVTRLGAARNDYINPGPYLKMPIDSVYNMSIQSNFYTVDLIAFSSDMQQVTTRLTVRYALNKEDSVRVYKTIGRNYEEKLIPPNVQEAVKNVFGHYTAESLVAVRGQVSEEIKAELTDMLKDNGLSVEDVAIENMDFSDAFEAAIESKQVATQEKLKTQTQQEEQTIVATAEAERQRISAQAEAEKILIAAQAESDAKKLAADAEAYRLQQESAYITDEIIQKEMIQKWNGKLPVTFGDTGSNILDVRDLMESDGAE